MDSFFLQEKQPWATSPARWYKFKPLQEKVAYKSYVAKQRLTVYFN